MNSGIVKCLRSLLNTFFNFIKSSSNQNLKNPCDSPILNKTFKATKNQPWTILDKDEVDDITQTSFDFRVFVFTITPVEFLFPEDENKFKELLLTDNRAYVRLYKTDESHETKEWNATRFSESPNLMANLRSGPLRGCKGKGICNAVIAINRNIPLFGE